MEAAVWIGTGVAIATGVALAVWPILGQDDDDNAGSGSH